MKFRPIAPQEDNTNQECDNDDCSLGSLGEINEMSRDFFLMAPKEIVEKDGGGSTRIGHKRPSFLSRRDRKRSDVDLNSSTTRRKCRAEIMTASTSSISQKCRVLLEPRCATEM